MKFIIQKYIERPLLINERKFDIRIWVLITHNMKVFMFREGYLRTSSHTFDLENLNDTYVHLTNNAVQKYSKTYGEFEDGNQLSFEQFQQYIDQNQLGFNFQEKHIPQIKEMIELSAKSVKKKLNPNRR